MEESDIHRVFLDIEEQERAFDITADGVPVWERVRVEVYLKIREETKDWVLGNADESSPSIRGSMGLFYLMMKNTVRRNPFFADSCEFLYYGYYARTREDDGFCWDKYFDPVFQRLEDHNYLYVEKHTGQEHSVPARTGNIRYIDLIYVFNSMKQVSGLVNFKLDDDTETRLMDIADNIASELNVRIDIPSMVESRLQRRRSLKPLYRKFLNRIDPSVVVLVVHYGKETFVEVCKELGIPVVELQHGILTEHEYSYHFPGSRTKWTFPDYFFTWGEVWNENVEFPIDDDHVIPVGHPYMDLKQSKFSDKLVKDQILFVSQPNIGHDLSRYATSLVNDFDISSDVIFKLHPKEYNDWKRRYPGLEQAEVTVVDNEGQSLYRLFAESHTQIGVFSTALYEGLNFDLETYIVRLPGVENVSRLYTEGPAQLVESVAELAEHINGRNNTEQDMNAYFRNDAIQNIERELDRIRSIHRSKT